MDPPSIDLLVPPPKVARRLDRRRLAAGRWQLTAEGLATAEVAALDWALGRAHAALERLGGTAERSTLRLVRDDTPPLGRDRTAAPAASYRLRLDGRGAEITAVTTAGFRHGLVTLYQWLALHEPGQPVLGLEIVDGPDFAQRGFLLDVSRNRVPTMAELERLIERLASLKYNQLQLYTEHTFAYAGHEVVWRGWDPLTADEIRHLVAFGGARGVELVPNQNSFGHFHRWLVHDAYRPLAECPDGVEHPFSPDPEPFSLCATDPGSLDLLRDLYAQLLPCFGEGGFFNTGLDETLDLGRCRTKDLCARDGKAAVYLEFLGRVHALARDHGRRMQFWGDVILEHPEHLDRLPDDVVALAWGYEADHPFDDVCRRLAASGVEHWVCPGTSSWNSVSGRTRNMLTNVATAARAGHRHGARGLLLTDWGDHGHLQPPWTAWPGMLAGAACAWNTAAADRLDDQVVARWLDHHVLPPEDAAGMGQALLDLGDVHSLTGASSLNGSALFFALLFAQKPAADRRAGGMTRDGVEQARDRIRALRGSLAEGLVAREARWAADVLLLGADLAATRLEYGVDRAYAELPSKVHRRVADRLDGLLSVLEPLWTARSRRGGLAASEARLRRALRA